MSWFSSYRFWYCGLVRWKTEVLALWFFVTSDRAVFEVVNSDDLSFHFCRGMSEGRAALYGPSAYVHARRRGLLGRSLPLSHCLRVFTRALAVFRELEFVAPLTLLGEAHWGSPFRMMRRGMRRGGPSLPRLNLYLLPRFSRLCCWGEHLYSLFPSAVMN